MTNLLPYLAVIANEVAFGCMIVFFQNSFDFYDVWFRRCERIVYFMKIPYSQNDDKIEGFSLNDVLKSLFWLNDYNRSGVRL